MNRVMFRRLLTAAAILPLTLVLIGSTGWTQGDQLAAADAPVAKEKKQRAKPKGRLPNYYKDVVTEDQKKEIYAIQAKYRDQQKALAAQIKALKDKLNEEIEAVLTAEQKGKIAKIAEEAAAKRKKAAADKKAAASKKAAEKKAGE